MPICSDAWICDCQAWLVKIRRILIKTPHALIVMWDSLLFEHDKFCWYEVDGTLQVFAAVLQLALHLTATGQVVANDGFVIRIKWVGIFRLDHDLVGLQQALHTRVPFIFLLGTQLLDRLLI